MCEEKMVAGKKKTKKKLSCYLLLFDFGSIKVYKYHVGKWWNRLGETHR